MANDGELKEEVVKSRHASATKLPAPYCTESQMVRYLDEFGTEVACIHQYLKPDGELWASGLPDPKRLLHDGVRYHYKSSKK